MHRLGVRKMSKIPALFTYSHIDICKLQYFIRYYTDKSIDLIINMSIRTIKDGPKIFESQNTYAKAFVN